MSLVELALIAVGLSMDAFAVSVCKGLATPKCGVKEALTVGLYFGVFQAMMPLIGYFAGTQIAGYIESFDHWIAFAVLAAIGGKMIKESREKTCPTDSDALSPGKMFPLAVATSIDALAVGVSFAFLRVEIGPSVALIGSVTLALSMLGMRIGALFGVKLKSGAELVGGVILVLIGMKILLEHLGALKL